MREPLPYGKSCAIVTAVLDAEGSPAGLVLEVGMTFAAGDVTLQSSEQPATALTAELVAFTSGGTEQIYPGDTLTGATSAETCVVIDVIVTSGSWAGGDAAGFIFAESVSGVFQSENLNNTTTGTANVATIGADFTAGVGAVVADSKSIAFALTSAETQCRWGQVEIVDQTDTEVWLETTYPFVTYGHPYAFHKPEGDGFILASGIVGDTGNSTTALHLVDQRGAGLSYSNDELNDLLVAVYDVSAEEWHSTWSTDFANTGSLLSVEALPFTPANDTDRYVITSIKRKVDVARWLGTAVSAATDGIPNVNTEYINDTEVVGVGTSGDKWRA